MSRIANRQLTKLRERNRFADLAQVLAAILLLIVPAFLYAAQRADYHRAERQMARLQQRLADLEMRRRLLEIQLASEIDPRRLRDKARTIAGLDEAQPEQVLFLARPGSPESRDARPAPISGVPDGHP